MASALLACVLALTAWGSADAASLGRVSPTPGPALAGPGSAARCHVADLKPWPPGQAQGAAGHVIQVFWFSNISTASTCYCSATRASTAGRSTSPWSGVARSLRPRSPSLRAAPPRSPLPTPTAASIPGDARAALGSRSRRQTPTGTWCPCSGTSSRRGGVRQAIGDGLGASGSRLRSLRAASAEAVTQIRTTVGGHRATGIAGRGPGPISADADPDPRGPPEGCEVGPPGWSPARSRSLCGLGRATGPRPRAQPTRRSTVPQVLLAEADLANPQKAPVACSLGLPVRPVPIPARSGTTARARSVRAGTIGRLSQPWRTDMPPRRRIRVTSGMVASGSSRWND